MKQQFVFFFWFVDWSAISLGVSLNLKPLHVEIHLPFGFIKIGMVYKNYKPMNYESVKHRGFGLMERYL